MIFNNINKPEPHEIKFWLKELKSALNFTRQEKPFFSNEKEFLNSYRGDKDIEYNYVIKDPIKYFRSIIVDSTSGNSGIILC